MKKLLRYYLINFASLWIATQIVPGLIYRGDFKTLLIGGLAFTIINFLLVPLLKILFLPLNLLTLGLFSWLINVLALFVLTSVVSGFQLVSFHFEGLVMGGFSIPSMELTSFYVAVIASFIIGIITHFLQWLTN